MTETQSTINNVLKKPSDFMRDCIHILNRCTKPDKREYIKVAQAIAIGFCFMGFIGYFIQIIHIPIRKLLV